MELDATAIFEAELSRRKLAFERREELVYSVRVGDLALTVNLENVARNATRDEDPDAIRRFVDHIVSIRWDTPDWTEASARLLFCADSAELDLDGVVHTKVSDEVCRVLTVTKGDYGDIAWVTSTMCESWGVSPETACEVASCNQDKLLEGLELEIAEADGHKLGMVPLDSPYKASVIFAPSFKGLVSKKLGWPVLVVIPCRDFIYVLEDDREFLSRVGKVVVEQFANSGYPITTEVLCISDDGIEAIGSFPR